MTSVMNNQSSITESIDPSVIAGVDLSASCNACDNRDKDVANFDQFFGWTDSSYYTLWDWVETVETTYNQTIGAYMWKLVDKGYPIEFVWYNVHSWRKTSGGGVHIQFNELDYTHE